MLVSLFGSNFRSLRDPFELSMVAADLKRSEESFRILLEKNPIPMWVVDRETHKFLAVNNAAASHYGYSREQFLELWSAVARFIAGVAADGSSPDLRGNSP